MVDEQPADSGDGKPDSRPKRPPPTIDLDTSEVSGDTRNGGARAGGPGRAAAAAFAAILPVLAGAVAALIAIAILWAAGWLGPQAASAPGEVAATSDKLAAVSDRVAGLERRFASLPPAAVDTGLRSRTEALEHAVEGLRSDDASLRRTVEANRAAVEKLQAAPPAASSPDVSALGDRLARLEQTVRGLPGEVQSASRSAEETDTRLRRLAVATLLEDRVRRGEPFADVLGVAKGLADNAGDLAPLEHFANSGVPTNATLANDLLALLPQLGAHTAPASAADRKDGLLSRLAADASKLVRVERADAPVAPSDDETVRAVADAARRGDLVRAREALLKLPPEMRAGAQSWLERVQARDAALQAAATFSSDALAALSKSAG